MTRTYITIAVEHDGDIPRDRWQHWIERCTNARAVSLHEDGPREPGDPLAPESGWLYLNDRRFVSAARHVDVDQLGPEDIIDGILTIAFEPTGVALTANEIARMTYDREHEVGDFTIGVWQP